MIQTIIAWSIVGLLGVIAAEFLFKKEYRKINRAKKKLKQNALSCPSNSIDVFLGTCKISKKDEQAARLLLLSLSEILDVDPARIAKNLPLIDLFTVEDVNEKTGEIQRFSPFAYDLVEIVVSLSDKRLWEQKWIEHPKSPDTEDELADFILNMTIVEFLQSFAPVTRNMG
jgi:hypothetical protein